MPFNCHLDIFCSCLSYHPPSSYKAVHLKSFFQSLKNKNPHWEVEPLWFEWLVLVGLFVFATWLLGIQGVWHLLLSSDPTGITLIIIIIFAVATLWCGVR